MAFYNNVIAGAAGAGAGAGAGFKIERSLRFNKGDSPSLMKSFSSSGNRKKWTFSCWFKLGLFSQPGRFFSAGPDSTSRTNIYYHSSNSSSGIAFYSHVGGSVEAQGNTTAVLRDPAAWYHLVFVFDCANSTNSNRVKIYINGVEHAVTFQAHPTNIDHYIGGNGAHYVGRGADGYSFDGYLADVHYVNGQTLAPTDFGEVDATTGVWSPIEFTGSHGTNGFHLDFSDNSSNNALGNDAAGSNNFAANNLSVAAGSGNDSLLDSPTNYDASSGNNGGNYATWSPIAAQTSGSIALSNGNLDTTCGSTRTTAMSTFPLTGKTYWEITFGSGTYNYIGMTEATGFNTVANNNSGIKYTGYQSYSYGWSSGDGKLYKASNILASPGAYTNGDVVGWAYDADNNTLKLYKNGSLVHTENSIADAQYFPAITHSGTATASTNFGQRPFAYTPPTGHVSLCTQNLVDAGIDNPSTIFDSVLYTGDGQTTQTVALPFDPGLVWQKKRSGVSSHYLFDAIRGINNNKALGSHTTAAEGNNSAYYSLSASGSNLTLGDVGVGNEWNINNQAHVIWTWEAGSSNTTVATNANGTGLPGADCVYRANTTAGFSIVRVASPTSTETRVHGLNKKPDLIICKSTDSADSWHTYHSSLGYQKYINLNQSNGASTSDQFGSQEPTSTYFYVKSNTGSGANKSDGMIYYIWHAVEGYSAFGSYTAKDAPNTIYTGFRPELVLCKRHNSSGESWLMTTAATQATNSFGLYLGADLSNAEGNSPGYMDLVSNGFVHRHNSGWNNAVSSGEYIYMAWAEHPFKYARAR